MNRDDLNQEQADAYNEQRALIHWRLKARPIVDALEGESDQRQDIWGMARVVKRQNQLFPHERKITAGIVLTTGIVCNVLAMNFMAALWAFASMCVLWWAWRLEDALVCDA